MATIGMVLMSSAHAHADPTAAELERQIDDEWNKLEPVIEQHNAIRLQLEQSRTKSAALAAQIQPIQLQLDLAQTTVGDIAVRVYMGSDTSALNALLTSGSPTALAEQLSLLDQVARVRQEQIRSAANLKSSYEDQKRPLDLLVAQLARSEADLAAKAKQIDTEIKRLQALRARVVNSGGGGNGTAGRPSGGGGAPAPRPSGCPASNPGGKAGVAVTFACAQIGKPYKWGAAGPGAFDCSGLVKAAWAKAGVTLPHNAKSQRGAVPSVSRANLRPGDLVFYYNDLHHVGMYVGNGWIVHASQAGVPIKMRVMDNGAIHSFGRPG